jgi:predicted RND superfamily exporter protein
MALSNPVERFFAAVVRWRIPLLVAYGLLLPFAVLMALRIPSESALDQLIVPSDPDHVATRAFQRIFPESPMVMLLFEAPDPWSPQVLAGVAATEANLRAIPKVTAYGVLDVYEHAHPGFQPNAETAAKVRAFATGTSFFTRQGLVGTHFLGVAVSLAVPATDMDKSLSAIDAALRHSPLGSVTRVRKIGAPYVEAWIVNESRQATLRYFPILGVLVVAVVLFLYRSWRTLLAILGALGTAVAIGLGAGSLLGFSSTLVSALVPLTLMVTTLATLVYLQSRYVDQPEGVSVDDHQAFALANKLLPVTASALAAMLGFGALAISDIRPVREMGIWIAVGLGTSWVVAFTLFPALQKAWRTPTGRIVPIRSALYDRVARALPAFTYRWRWPFVTGSLILMAAGIVALVGVPGRLAPMSVGVDDLDYIDPELPLRRDILFFRDHVAGLSVAHLWIQTAPDAVVQPEVLRGIDRLATAIEQIPNVSSVTGPTTSLRLRRYLAGQGDTLPQDPETFARLTADLEQLLLTESQLRGFIDIGTLANAQLTVVFSHGEEAGYVALRDAVRRAWDETVTAVPALRGATLRVVGEALLQAKVGANLVPTLTESFAITAGLIFLAFVFVFRSARARLMAMIPSLLAILVTFLGMRLAGAALNVATILIATTVLGTTENDQIHFFHHLQEGGANGSLEPALRHTLRVSGRAIVFATFINAIGFLGLTLSSFPPLRQFGFVTSSAFLLAMLADFTALPASMWLLSGERPGAQTKSRHRGVHG